MIMILIFLLQYLATLPLIAKKIRKNNEINKNKDNKEIMIMLNKSLFHNYISHIHTVYI